MNFETKEKNYVRSKHFCPNDGWVAFRSGDLISGNIAKKAIGDGSKSGLLYVVLRDYGCEETAKIMDRWSKLCGRYMGNHRGLSIGISDVAPDEELMQMKHEILLEGYKQAEANIELYEKGELVLRPGCNLLHSLEEILNGTMRLLLAWLVDPRISHLSFWKKEWYSHRSLKVNSFAAFWWQFLTGWVSFGLRSRWKLVASWKVF